MARVAITVAALQFLTTAVAEASDQDTPSIDNLRDFALLVAQNHPGIFNKVAKAVSQSDFSVEEIESKIEATTAVAVIEPAKKEFTNGTRYTASLTDDEFQIMRQIRGSQRDYAVRKLIEFDSTFADRLTAANYWVSALPSFKAYGC